MTDTDAGCENRHVNAHDHLDLRAFNPTSPLHPQPSHNHGVIRNFTRSDKQAAPAVDAQLKIPLAVTNRGSTALHNISIPISVSSHMSQLVTLAETADELGVDVKSAFTSFLPLHEHQQQRCQQRTPQSGHHGAPMSDRPSDTCDTSCDMTDVDRGAAAGVSGGTRSKQAQLQQQLQQQRKSSNVHKHVYFNTSNACNTDIPIVESHTSSIATSNAVNINTGSSGTSPSIVAQAKAEAWADLAHVKLGQRHRRYGDNATQISMLTQLLLSSPTATSSTISHANSANTSAKTGVGDCGSDSENVTKNSAAPGWQCDQSTPPGLNFSDTHRFPRPPPCFVPGCRNTCRILHLRRGSMFEATDAAHSDIAVIEVKIRPALYHRLRSFLRCLKPGTRILTYEDLSDIFTGCVHESDRENEENQVRAYAVKLYLNHLHRLKEALTSGMGGFVIDSAYSGAPMANTLSLSKETYEKTLEAALSTLLYYQQGSAKTHTNAHFDRSHSRAVRNQSAFAAAMWLRRALGQSLYLANRRFHSNIAANTLQSQANYIGIKSSAITDGAIIVCRWAALAPLLHLHSLVRLPSLSLELLSHQQQQHQQALQQRQLHQTQNQQRFLAKKQQQVIGLRQQQPQLQHRNLNSCACATLLNSNETSSSRIINGNVTNMAVRASSTKHTNTDLVADKQQCVCACFSATTTLADFSAPSRSADAANALNQTTVPSTGSAVYSDGYSRLDAGKHSSAYGQYFTMANSSSSDDQSQSSDHDCADSRNCNSGSGTSTEYEGDCERAEHEGLHSDESRDHGDTSESNTHSELHSDCEHLHQHKRRGKQRSMTGLSSTCSTSRAGSTCCATSSTASNVVDKGEYSALMLTPHIINRMPSLQREEEHQQQRSLLQSHSQAQGQMQEHEQQLQHPFSHQQSAPVFSLCPSPFLAPTEHVRNMQSDAAKLPTMPGSCCLRGVSSPATLPPPCSRGCERNVHFPQPCVRLPANQGNANDRVSTSWAQFIGHRFHLYVMKDE